MLKKIRSFLGGALILFALLFAVGATAEAIRSEYHDWKTHFMKEDGGDQEKELPKGVR